MTKRVSQCARQRLDEGMLGFVPLQVLATAARALGYGMIGWRSFTEGRRTPLEAMCLVAPGECRGGLSLWI
jgi:hypothetical protein